MSAGAENDGQEKTHEATPHRLQKARDEGDIPRSTDAGTFAAYAGLALALGLAGEAAVTHLGELLTAPLARPFDLADRLLGSGGGATFGGGLGAVMAAALPIFALPAIAVVLVLVAQQGVTVASKKLQPKLSRINPIENAKQKYGLKGMVEFLKSAVKLLAIALILVMVIRAEVPILASHVHLDARLSGGLLARAFWDVITGVMIVSAIVAVLDILWQRLSFMNRMRMSHQELRDETKGTEGDPYMKQERRERGRKIAQNQALRDVAKADVVITNPEHYAVALQWDRSSGRAPVCLAKGLDQMALTIRRKATEAKVPIHPDPPTARALHASVEIGQEIRPDHYKAVAAAIVFAEKMRAEARRSWRSAP